MSLHRYYCPKCKTYCHKPNTYICPSCSFALTIKKTSKRSSYVTLQQLGKLDKWICCICNKPIDPAAKDKWKPTREHILPRSQGGSNHISNLRIAHYKCNHKRGDKSINIHPRPVLGYDEFRKTFTRTPIDKILNDEYNSYRDHYNRKQWKKIIRQDPCSYCHCKYSGSIDHIESRSIRRKNGIISSWIEYTGSCKKCGSTKSLESLLLFLLSERKTECI